MNCQNAERAILLAETGELSDRKLRELDGHLATCAACAQYRRSARGIVASARESRPAAEPSPTVMTRIRAAAAQRPVSRFVLFRQPVVQVLAYAAALAVLAGGWFVFFPGSSPKAAPLNVFSTIMHATAETTPAAVDARGNAARELEVRTLARELLTMEGLVDEEVVEMEAPDAEATSDEELSPTVLRGRSSPVSAPSVCG
jgi:hypothetical protein